MTRDGYLLVTATIKGTKTVTGAHRLVWTYFNNPIPAGLTINHKNGLKNDNHPKNLEVATHSEQRIHAIRVLGARHWDCRGSNHPKTHLLESDVLEMRRLRVAGMMVKDLAAKYDMAQKAVSAICCRKTWKHV